MSTSTADLPDRLADIVADFHALPPADRLQLLVELGEQLPDPPEGYRREQFEAVLECQAPVYVLAELAGEQSLVRLHILAPRQAPTTRGFAGLLHEALDGAPASELLALPEDVHTRLGLDGAVSPLRLQGMAGMLTRIRRQVAAASS